MRTCVIRTPDSVTRLESVSLTRGRIGGRRSLVCVSPSKLAPMPSVEMRRSTRIFVPKTKEAEGVKVLRSGRKLSVDSSESKIKHSGKVTDGRDLIRLIGDSYEATADRSEETGWQNRMGDKERESDVLIIDDLEKAEHHLENRVLPSEVTEGVSLIKRFGVVYTRKRKRLVKNLDSLAKSDIGGSKEGGDRRFGLHFFERKRKRVAKSSAYLEKTVDCFVENRYMCVLVDMSCDRSCDPAGVVTSVLRYTWTAKVGLLELSGFLQSQPIAGVFASYGISFLLNESRNAGFCNIYGAGELTPSFEVNFSSVPPCFIQLHARMWFRLWRLSSLLLINADRKDEDDTELDDDFVLLSPRFRAHSSNCNALGPESSNLGGLKMLNAPFAVSRSAIRAVPYRNGVATRSSQRRRKRSLRPRRASNPSFLGMNRGGLSVLDSGIRKKPYSSFVSINRDTQKSIQKKSSNGDMKLLKSTLLALGKDIDSVSCSVNLLVVEPDRCFRETGACVTLEVSTSNEWILAIRKDGSLRCYHRAQKGKEVKPSCTNRYTYAIIWCVEAGWKLEFTERKDWAIFKELFKLCGDRNIVPPSHEKAIPIPGVCEVSVCDIPHDAPYLRPESYIKMKDDELSRSILKRTASYDMDCEDEEWLNALNSKLDAENDRCVQITESNFELMIDAFEKAAFVDPGNFTNEKAPADLFLEFASREVVETVYSYWRMKRKQKRGPLLRVFQLNEPKKTPAVANPVLRKKRSMKQRHTHSARGNPIRRGKESRVLQAILAKQTSNEEKTTMLEVEQAAAAAKIALEVAVAKRRKAQTLMASADLAMYRATMAIRIAEAAHTAEPDQTVSHFLD